MTVEVALTVNTTQNRAELPTKEIAIQVKLHGLIHGDWRAREIFVSQQLKLMACLRTKSDCAHVHFFTSVVLTQEMQRTHKTQLPLFSTQLVYCDFNQSFVKKSLFCYQNGEQNCGVALLAHHHSRGSWSAWKHWRSLIPTLHGCTNIRTNNRRNGLFKPCRRLNKHITDWADLLFWVQNWEILEFLSGFRSYRFKTISRLDQVLQIPTW